ncbi:DUF3106 domain-containing protein [Herbaspirillum lusitanum]|uniref:DUF3106 domain-containing protein n=1 Tax=Herbaspirillum lusitanum TaxID=213312 RepID=A0ABW9A1H1_9BURK
MTERVSRIPASTPSTASRKPAGARGAAAVLMLIGGLSCAWALAQSAPTVTSAPATPSAAPATPASSTPAPAKSTALPPVKPAPKVVKKGEFKPWGSLPAAQQQALDPLVGEWSKMSDLQKEKWLAISKKYAKMNPEEQQRLHDRMRDWVKLTPAQRRAARESFTRAKQLDAEKKNEQWNKYQQLSEEQKKKLAQAKLPKRVAKLPTAPSKAAPAIQLPPEALEQSLAPGGIAPPVNSGVITPAAAVQVESK